MYRTSRFPLEEKRHFLLIHVPFRITQKLRTGVENRHKSTKTGTLYHLFNVGGILDVEYRKYENWFFCKLIKFSVHALYKMQFKQYSTGFGLCGMQCRIEHKIFKSF